MFQDMHDLAFIHLGVHNFPRLPSFQGLTNLKQLVIVYLFTITEMPSFEPLEKLEQLSLIYLPALPGIADMAPLTNLQQLAAILPMPWCCNGFLGSCDLAHPFCTANPTLSIPQASCLRDGQPRATAATKAVFARFPYAVCPLTIAVPLDIPTADSVGMCAGRLFRKCALPVVQWDGSTAVTNGICVNTRMQVLACDVDPLKVAVRKVQIQRGVGPKCDPEVEAWLGCAK